ncbi:MAG: hypothetical protein ACRD2L_14055, partial [Terriglobia bacterium]
INDRLSLADKRTCQRQQNQRKSYILDHVHSSFLGVAFRNTHTQFVESFPIPSVCTVKASVLALLPRLKFFIFRRPKNKGRLVGKQSAASQLNGLRVLRSANQKQ